MFCSIGFEIELDLFGGSCDVFYERYRNARMWQREYYSTQIERNDFRFIIYNLDDLYEVLRYVSDYIRCEIIDISIDTDYYVPIDSVYFEVCNSIVSNGVHVHIGGINRLKEYAENNDVNIGHVYNKFRQFIVRNYIDIFGLSGRFAFSHHVFGFYRRTRYGFKKKGKFRPALYRYEYDTFELRMFNLEDLFDVDKMYEFFKKIYKFNVNRIEKVRKSRVQSRLERIRSECDNTWVEFIEKEGKRFRASEEISCCNYGIEIAKKINVIKGSSIEQTYNSTYIRYLR